MALYKATKKQSALQLEKVISDVCIELGAYRYRNNIRYRLYQATTSF